MQWLITYFVHSSLLLGCALALDWRRRLTSRGAGTWPWRLALYGGVITATLQPAIYALASEPGFTRAPGGSPVAEGSAFSPALILTLQGDITDFTPMVLACWLGVGGIGIAYLLARLVRLTRDIRQLPTVDCSALEHFVAMLAARATVVPPRLRLGARFTVPILAPGRTICIPPWMLEGYERARLHAALAHEMGHLLRRDNFWRIVDRVVALAGWLQPLNRIALRRLDESAEFACDAWAARATGLRRELAESLQDCALRMDGPGATPALAVGMSSMRTPLLERVIQLVEGPDMNIRNIRRAALWSCVALATMAVLGLFFAVSTLDDEVPPRWLAKMGVYQSLRNSGEQGHVVRSVIIDSPDRYVYVRVIDNFSLQPKAPGVADSVGSAVVAETRDGVTRMVRYEREAGQQLQRVYKIDGRTHELDADGARWLEAMLPIASL